LVTALFPALVLAGVGVVAVVRFRNRRRLARMRLSGGRKALALYLAERGR
jgi:hypothetical protein